MTATSGGVELHRRRTFPAHATCRTKSGVLRDELKETFRRRPFRPGRRLSKRLPLLALFASFALAPAGVAARPTLEIESAATHPTRNPFEVTLTFSEPVIGLEAGEVAVTDGTGAQFSGTGATYTLTVTPIADFEGKVTVSVPEGAATANGVGNEAASESFAVDTRGPVLSSATVTRKTVFLTYGEPLGSGEPDASAFVVKSGPDPASLSTVALASMDGISVAGPQVRLKLASAVSADDVVTVSYTVPASGTKIEDVLGNPAESLTERNVDRVPATITGEFEFSCPAPSVAEGTTLTCTLVNLGSEAGPWPVAGLVHLSTDDDRALVRRDVALTATDATVENGLWWIGETLVGYSRFDWSGDATAGSSRDVTVTIIDDGDYEPAERFYLALAADGSRNVGALVDSAAAVVIDASDTKSTDATLGGEAFSLGFAGDTTAYQVAVDYKVTDVIVTPTTAHARASVTVNGDGVDSGAGSKALPLAVGNTTTTVVVSAENDSVVSYEIAWARADRGEHVEVETEGFRLRCRSWVLEGLDPECDLANTGSDSRNWPVVAVLHSSADDNRALVARDPSNADDDSFVRDLRIAGGNKQAGYNFGYGELFSGESRCERLTYGYEKFDWDGNASANQGRRVPIEVIDDGQRDAGPEVFHVALAPSGYNGLSKLVDNRVPVVILCAPRLLSATPGDQTLEVSWTAPGCDSEPSEYKVQWRSGGEAYDASRQASVSSLSHAIPSLTNGTEYSVRVIAVRTDRDSEPSNEATATPDASPSSGSGSPEANSPPAFSSPSSFSVAENQLAIGTLTAWDSDALDVVVDCQVTGGADAALFAIQDGDRLVFRTAQDYEAPADVASTDPPGEAGDNRYHLVVSATSGTGTRAMTVEQALVVTVTDVQEERTLSITGLSSDTVAENNAYSASPTLEGTPIGNARWTLEGADGADFGIDSASGSLSMAARNYEEPADADGDNEYEVTVRATDEDENTAAVDITVTVTDVVEIAQLSITGLSSGMAAENSPYAGTPVLQGTPIGNVEWNVEGIDSWAFSIDAATGRLTMTAQDYENPADTDRDNDYLVTVHATDEDGNSALMSIVVTVTDVVERSTLRIDGLSDAAIGENAPWRSPAPTVTGAIGAVAWTREGADAGHFEIDPATGVLTLPEQDYEAPADDDGDNVYRVTVKATDSDANQATRTIGVSVTDTIEVSTLIVEGMTDASTPENVPWTSSAPAVTGAIGTVTWSKAGADADEFSIDAGIGVLGLSPRNFESPTDDDGDNVYEVTVSATDADDNRASVVVSITVTDSAETANVRIEGIADGSTPENAAWTSTAPVAAGAIGAVSWGREGADGPLFDIDPSGGILTLAARDYESPDDADRNNVYEVTVKAIDSDGNAGTRAVRVTVADEREFATVLVSGLADVLVEENQAWTSPMPLATGGIGPVSWSQHGEDASAFRIDARSGVLTLPPQDYEMPGDADGDRVYRVTARATDADENEGEQSMQVTVTDADDPVAPSDPGSGGGGGGGGAANRPPVVEREIANQVIDVGELLELDIRLNFYDRDQRALDYTVASANPGVATAAVDRNGVLTIRGISRGVTELTVTAADRRDERASSSFRVTVRGPQLVPLVPSASDTLRQGFLRVINRSENSGEVSIEAIDDGGTRAGTVDLTIGAGAAAHFNSDDLEQGNPDKGLSGGVGSGDGNWRLVLDSELEFEALAYIRSNDGFLTSMHDQTPIIEGEHWVATFNPGSNANQASSLRLVNAGTEEAQVSISGIDDAGASPGEPVLLTLPAGTARLVTAVQLEGGGEGLTGKLGDGSGKWRLRLSSNNPIVVMNLMSSRTGHLTNLSTAPKSDVPAEESVSP